MKMEHILDIIIMNREKKNTIQGLNFVNSEPI